MLRYAAIDIGSNAMRMLFQQVYETSNGPIFKKLSLIRLPVRLGDDAFLKGEICEKKTEHLIDMAYSFKHLCRIFEVDEYQATATSAMREASNGMEIISRIRNEVGIDISIIPGEEEANILCESIFNTGKVDLESTYLMIDVGGGSTEINIVENGERKEWESFNIGAVRLKEGLVQQAEKDRFDNWLKSISEKYQLNYAVGTGGNINKIYKLCGLKDWAYLNTEDLSNKIDFLSTLSTTEMIEYHDIKPDRADVIVDGGSIYLQAMKSSGIESMIVPKVGLPDGLIRRMYYADKD